MGRIFHSSGFCREEKNPTFYLTLRGKGSHFRISSILVLPSLTKYQYQFCVSSMVPMCAVYRVHTHPCLHGHTTHTYTHFTLTLTCISHVHQVPQTRTLVRPGPLGEILGTRALLTPGHQAALTQREVAIIRPASDVLQLHTGRKSDWLEEVGDGRAEGHQQEETEGKR